MTPKPPLTTRTPTLLPSTPISRSGDGAVLHTAGAVARGKVDSGAQLRGARRRRHRVHRHFGVARIEGGQARHQPVSGEADRAGDAQRALVFGVESPEDRKSTRLNSSH